MAFSAACGASRSIDELWVPTTSPASPRCGLLLLPSFLTDARWRYSIIFRALQGIGGSGTMALPSTIFFQIVPTSGYSTMNAVLSCTLAIALIVSPLIGGGLSNGNHWRWIFYLKQVRYHNLVVYDEFLTCVTRLLQSSCWCRRCCPPLACLAQSIPSPP